MKRARLYPFVIVFCMLMFAALNGCGNPTGGGGGGGSTTYSLSFTITPEEKGTVETTPASSGGKYAPNTYVQLSAATLESDWVFASWEGSVSGETSPTSLIMNSNKNITVVFRSITSESYTLTAAATPSVGGSMILDPSGGVYPDGTVVTVTASADSTDGYSFSSWEGDLTGITSNTAAITMNSSKDVVAVFTHAGPVSYHYLTILKDPSDGGTVTMEPAGGVYTHGTVVAVIATADASLGYSFENWSGNLTGSTNPTTITITSSKEITANFGRDIWVDSTGSDSGTGTSESPYLTIQHAMDMATSNHTIHVAAGEYDENIAWTTTETGVSLSGADPVNTVIDGNSLGSCITIENVAAAQTITIEGFTIKRGYIWGKSGGGIRLHSDDVTLFVNNSIIRNNEAGGTDGNGGGLGIYHYSTGAPTAIVQNCVFSSNEGNYGGAIVNGDGSTSSDNSSMQISNCTFEYNSTTNAGGAVFSSNPQFIMSECDIHSNSSGTHGGGILLYYGGSIKNCAIFNNTSNSSDGGGGIYDVPATQTTYVVSCSIVSNEAKTSLSARGGGIRTMNNTQIINCIIWGNKAKASDNDIYDAGWPTIRYSDVKEFPSNFFGGAGTTDAYPVFAVFPPTQVSDLALQSGSPVKESGTDEAVVPSTDYTGDARSAPYSMGAFEED